MKKFSSVGIGEWWDELKNGQKLKIGDAHASPQEICKKYKRQSLGMPLRHPFFIGKNQVTFQDTIFLLLHALCIFLGVSVVLVFFISLFICCNKWLDPNKFLLEKLPCFSFAKNAPVFTLIKNRVFFFFCYCFWFSFLPWFAFRSSYIYSSRCSFASDLYWFSSKEVFIKSSNGVGKEKKLYAKKWYKKELV
jgi:hypothetical protein